MRPDELVRPRQGVDPGPQGGREGARLDDLNDRVWHALGDDLADALGIEYDEMVEVAP